MAGGVEQSWWIPEGDALVIVNHKPVTQSHLMQVAKRAASVTERALSAAERQQLLELLIDEELMLQHIESQGSLSAEPRLRKELVHRVIDKVVQQFLATPVSDAALEVFYQEHQAVFKRAGAVAVTVFRFDALEQAKAVNREALELHDDHIVEHVPRGLMPASGLRRYLGPSLTQVAMSLRQGQLSEPQMTAEGVYLLYAKEVKPAYQPAYSEVKDDVRAEYFRRGRDIALGELLSVLRDRADIRINNALVNNPRGEDV